MNKKEVIVQVLKDVASKRRWLCVSEPLSLSEAQNRQKFHERQYPKNTYRILSLKEKEVISQ